MTDAMELVTRHTQEIVTEEEVAKALKKKEPVAYMGYAPTGELHIGHLLPIMKIADFLDAGFKFKFLIADIHAYLDDQKSPWELLDARSEYYETAIRAMVEACGTNADNLEFVKGSAFQLKEEYMMNVLRMAGNVTFNRVKRAASEVVRLGDAPKLGGLMYPLLQVQDVLALDADVTLSGVDQRGIYMLGRDMLPEIGERKYACVFTPLLPGLTGSKMSASDKASKIGVTDSEEELKKKMKSAFCEAGAVEGNGVLIFMKQVVFPLKERKGESFTVHRPEKFGGDLEYKDYAALEKDFEGKKLHPLDLKNALAEELAKLLEPVRKAVSKELLLKAYG